MKVLVTGGAGFIGSHLVERLLERGADVVVVDNFNDFYDPAVKRHNVAGFARRVRLYEQDICDAQNLQSVFSSERPTHVVHLAAWAGVRPSIERPALYTEVNVTGTVNLLECSVSSGVQQFVFGSSSSVYGINSKVPFEEDDPLNQPISPYAVTKRAGELLCSIYHHNHGLPVTCLRFFTVYGPRQRPEMAIHKFARMINRGEEIPLYGQGALKRDYTYVDDILQGIEAAIERNYAFDIFNLGNSYTIALTELVELLEKKLGKRAKVRLLPEQMGDVPITYADIQKARRMLGYAPRYDISTGLDRFVEWYLSAPQP